MDRGDRVDVGEVDARFDERLRDDVVDELDVRAARDLGHDAAEAGVQVGLARHDRRPHDAPVLDHRRRGLVARRLDPEDARSPGLRSLVDGRSGDPSLDAVQQLRRTRACRPRTPTSRARPRRCRRSSPCARRPARSRTGGTSPARRLFDSRTSSVSADRVARDRLAREREQEPRADVVPVPRGVDGDRRDVTVGERHHQARRSRRCRARPSRRRTRASTAARARSRTGSATTAAGTPAARCAAHRGGAGAASARCAPRAARGTCGARPCSGAPSCPRRSRRRSGAGTSGRPRRAGQNSSR